MKLFDEHGKPVVLDIAPGLNFYQKDDKFCVEYDEITSKKLQNLEAIQKEATEINKMLEEITLRLETGVNTVTSEINEILKVNE